jgi:hypothetical protein
MQKAAYIAQIDLEMGDEVKVIASGFVASITGKVYDIRTTYYLRSAKVTFEFMVETEDKESARLRGWYTREQIEYPIKEI